MRHLITFLLFIAAVLLYAAGSAPGMAILFVAGIVCELAGWRRLVKPRHPEVR